MTTTREVTCQRCGHARWTALQTPYTCQRCREVLAGGNARDPLAPPTTEQQRQTLDRARQTRARRGLEGPGHTEIAGA